jgi:hypothetical protein
MEVFSHDVDGVIEQESIHFIENRLRLYVSRYCVVAVAIVSGWRVSRYLYLILYQAGQGREHTPYGKHASSPNTLQVTLCSCCDLNARRSSKGRVRYVL